VIRHYSVPYVSIIDGLGPVKTPAALQWFEDTFLGDSCCHLSRFGQGLVALVMNDFLEKLVWSTLHEPVNGYEDRSDPVERSLLHASQHELDVFAGGRSLSFDTTADFPPLFRAPQGWSIYEDAPHKPGMIASVTGSLVRILINSLTFASHVAVGELHIVALKSYKGTGMLTVQLSTIDTPDIIIESKTFDCMWEDRSSEPSILVFAFRKEAYAAGMVIGLRITVAQPPRETNKVKVQRLTLY